MAAPLVGLLARAASPPDMPFMSALHPPATCLHLQFKPAPPNAIGSPEYIADLAEVFVVGRKDSTNRTQDQTDIANFWADGNSE